VREGTKKALATKRERALVRPRDLERLKRFGSVAPSLLPLLKIAEDEAVELAGALGGSANLTPQRHLLIEDCVAVGIALRTLLARFLQGDADADLASKIGTLAGQRRSSVVALGLDRHAREVRLDDYLAGKYGLDAETRAGEANGGDPDDTSR
jgi:hypothetical protein